MYKHHLEFQTKCPFCMEPIYLHVASHQQLDIQMRVSIDSPTDQLELPWDLPQPMEIPSTNPNARA